MLPLSPTSLAHASTGAMFFSESPLPSNSPPGESFFILSILCIFIVAPDRFVAYEETVPTAIFTLWRKRRNVESSAMKRRENWMAERPARRTLLTPDVPKIDLSAGLDNAMTNPKGKMPTGLAKRGLRSKRASAPPPITPRTKASPLFGSRTVRTMMHSKSA